MRRKITTYKLQLALLLACVLTFLTAFSIFAQGPSPSDDDVNRIAKKLFCPVCENTPLDVCPTEACRLWRAEIREMLEEGKTEQEIIDHFAVTYGERTSSDPRDKVKAYLLPMMAILLGAGLLVSALRAWKKPLVAGAGVPESEAESVAQDEYIARVEEELKKRS